MAILTSPAVAVVEKDYSQVVPFAATGEGAIAGHFHLGPINLPVLVSSVDQLENVFGRPSDENYKDWFLAYNFLQYSSTLWLTRIKPDGVLNAGAKAASASAGVEVLNPDDYDYMVLTGDASLAAAGEFVCKQPGAAGNNLRVVIVDNNNWDAFLADDTLKSENRHLSAYLRTGEPTTTQFAIDNTGNEYLFDEMHVFVIDVTGGVTGVAGRIVEMHEGLSKLDNATDFLGRVVNFGKFLNNYSNWIYYAADPATVNWNSFSTTVTGATWVDGVATLTLSKTNGLSVGDTITVSGITVTGTPVGDYNATTTVTAISGLDVSYAVVGDPGAYASGGTVVSEKGTIALNTPSSGATNGAFVSLDGIYNVRMAGGAEGSLAGVAKTTALIEGFNTFANKETHNVSYLIAGDYPTEVMYHVIQGIAEVRRDAIAFVSPHDAGQPFFDPNTIVQDLLDFRNIELNVNSSYAVMDSGYKYQYDGYNQKYRWIPLAADVAGLCARNDAEGESWHSPGGFTRGQIKNAIKLSSNLNKSQRDQLYPKQINSVVAFPGRGTVLFGDRTLQAKASAFQTIHIRRMFIIIEQAIENAAKDKLFELNNIATRSRFVGMIEPFLRSVQARDGLSEFQVVCNDTNNSDDVVARGEFVADIYVKPLYSIQYVVLNFVAVKDSVQFNQLIGTV